MPIYAYKCSACGHADDVLQKLSADPLTDCPACGQATYSKQVTAPQFQLKGSGWYVTDFRGGNTGGEKKESGENKGDAKSDGKPTADAATAPSEKGSEKSAETTQSSKADSAAACPVHSAPTATATKSSTPATPSAT